MATPTDRVCFSLPDWVAEHRATYLPTDDIAQRMAFVVDAARRNVDAGTGGPFAAAVFERVSGRLVALGVNRVPVEQLSMLHAEMVALALAQRACGSYDLGAAGLREHELFTSVEPCAMCLGGIAWAGVTRVVCGATDADARQIGFDEGPKPTDWTGALRERGIEVIEGVGREPARAVLEAYRLRGGTLYNGRRGR